MKPPQTISITQPRVTNQDTDKVYSDKKCNELRDEVVATRKQRDTLEEALRVTWEDIDHLKYWMPLPCRAKSQLALAAAKGGSHE